MEAEKMMVTMIPQRAASNSSNFSAVRAMIPTAKVNKGEMYHRKFMALPFLARAQQIVATTSATSKVAIKMKLFVQT